MHAPTTPTFSTRPSVPVWLWQSPKANPRSSRRDGRRRPEIFLKKFLAGTQQAGRSFARAVERPSRTRVQCECVRVHAGARWPLNRAPAAGWAILSVRSQGKLLPSFTIYNAPTEAVSSMYCFSDFCNISLICSKSLEKPTLTAKCSSPLV